MTFIEWIKTLGGCFKKRHLVNGKPVEWESVTIVINGVPIGKLMEIKYTKTPDPIFKGEAKGVIIEHSLN